VKSVVPLYSPAGITFCANQYKRFDRTYDIFGDGTVVVVPLPGDDENFAAGVFVNLVSGRSYFFIPLGAKVHSLARLPHGTRVISPEDVKSGNELTQFPQFER